MVASKASVATLDFTNTKDGVDFNKKRVPAGDYLAKVTKVVDSPTKDTKEPQWLFTIALVDKFTDRRFPYYCKLAENQLWKIRNLFIAAGITIPKKKLKLDPNRVVGKMIGVTLEDDEYDGKLQSNIVATLSPSEIDGSDADEPDEDEEEELEDGEEEEVEDSDEEDEADDEEETDDEEEEEPEPVRPAKKAAAKIPAQRRSSPTPARKAATSARRKPAPVEEDEELEELDIEEL